MTIKDIRAGLASSLGAWLTAGLVVATAAGAAERAGPRPGVDGPMPIATEARLAGDESRTRFVLDLTKTVPLTAFTLADPYRVVIDLPQMAFQLAAKSGDSGRGLIKAYRFGLVMQGGSRIVIDTTKPVAVDKAFVLDSVDGQPARLVLDLVAVDRETFLRTLALESRPRPAPEPTRKAERDPAKNADSRPLIVLDPGHGGLDNGTASAHGETEKTIVLGFALALRDKLERTGKYRITMTREDDTFVPLAERVKIARANQAALFVSIHADALARGDGDARGATVYTLSDTASDAEAARLAEAENKADVIAGVDLAAEPDEIADILIDLAQRETRNFSAHFARTAVNELKTSTRMHKHPLKSAGFKVLKAPDVPSVLIELGYVSNGADLKLLVSQSWRSRATDSLVQAIHTFFTTRVAGTVAPGGN